MPIGKYPDFATCQADMMSKVNPRTGKKYTKQEAGDVCGAMEKRMSEFRVLSAEFSEITEADLASKEFEIISAGKKIYRGRVMEITEADLAEMEQHFNEGTLGTQLPVNVDHGGQAFAWIANIRKVGDRLMATLKDFSDDGKKFLMQKMYKYFSVEIDNDFGKIIAGSKKTLKNVLRGVALTNYPVDKQLAPTFLSEKFYSLNSSNMETIKALAEALSKKEKLSKAEKELWKVAFASLSDEEKEESAPDNEAVEAKPEEAPEEPVAPAAPSDPVEPAAPAATPPEGEKKELSDRIISLQSELSKVQTERRNEKIAARVFSDLQLSEKNPTGLGKKDAEDATKLLQTLSDSQINAVVDILKKVRVMDFSEIGSSANGLEAKEHQGELKTLAEKRATEKGISYSQAVKQVLSERPELQVE